LDGLDELVMFGVIEDKIRKNEGVEAILPSILRQMGE
jgi:hypothetical protein